MTRIPLEKRLRQTGAGPDAAPAAAWLYLDTYFKTVSEMGAGAGCLAFYENALKNWPDMDFPDKFVAQIISEAMYGDCSGKTEFKILYHILARPFSRKQISRQERRDRK